MREGGKERKIQREKKNHNTTQYNSIGRLFYAHTAHNAINDQQASAVLIAHNHLLPDRPDGIAEKEQPRKRKRS